MSPQKSPPTSTCRYSLLRNCDGTRSCVMTNRPAAVSLKRSTHSGYIDEWHVILPKAFGNLQTAPSCRTIPNPRRTKHFFTFQIGLVPLTTGPPEIREFRSGSVPKNHFPERIPILMFRTREFCLRQPRVPNALPTYGNTHKRRSSCYGVYAYTKPEQKFAPGILAPPFATRISSLTVYDFSKSSLTAIDERPEQAW